MNIGKGKARKILGILNGVQSKNKPYIPAMHQHKPDTFERTTSQKTNDVETSTVQPAPIQDKVPESVTIDAVHVEEQEETPKTITREEVFAKLETTDIEQVYKQRFKESVKTQEQVFVLDKFLSNPDLFQNRNWCGLLSGKMEKITFPQKKLLFDKLLSEPKLYSNENLQRELGWYSGYSETLETVEAQNSFLDEYFANPSYNENEFLNNEFGGILFHLSSFDDLKSKKEIIDIFLANPTLQENEEVKKMLASVLRYADTKEQFELTKTLLSNPKLYENAGLQGDFRGIVPTMNDNAAQVSKAKNDLLNKYLSTPELNQNPEIQKHISSFVSAFNYSGDAIEEKYALIDKYLSNPTLYGDKELSKQMIETFKNIETQAQVDFVEKFFSEPTLFNNQEFREELPELVRTMSLTEYHKKDAQYKFDFLDKYYLNQPKMLSCPNAQAGIGRMLHSIASREQYEAKTKFLDVYLSEPRLHDNKAFQEKLTDIVCSFQTRAHVDLKFGLLNTYLSNPSYYENEDLQKCVPSAIDFVYSLERKEYAEKLLGEVYSKKITPAVCNAIMLTHGFIDEDKIKKLAKIMTPEDFELVAKKFKDIQVALLMSGLYGKNSVNEISITDKKDILRSVIEKNAELFDVSDEIKKLFPLIPQNRKEYCSFVPELVKSLGIETNPLSPQEIVDFAMEIQGLASDLKSMPESKINHLNVKQKYSKNSFIEDTLSIVEELPNSEKQKVYDYFGFELHPNKKAKTGYSIIGYPMNLNNGAKLQEIADETTKQVIEKLRPKVVAFTENNLIVTNVPDIDKELNAILNVFPELRTTIERRQYGAHDCDVFKHSLKVMQSVVQDPEFETLSESDKKIMVLASLFHDISKAECKPDPLHPMEGSFDTFYIMKKLNLTHDEQIKLYTLINYHQWSKYVNKKELTEEEQKQRLQSVAFDLQNDDLFKMAKIFTISDVKSIKKDKSLYFSLVNDIQSHAQKIEEYVAELQKTKPILPTTKLPKASDVADRITVVNDDGSTNLKGVYKKDGLVIVKYNEVEDWEALGFPKGSISRGINVQTNSKKKEINTGNIKFIAHGLNYESQLINFDAFALPDSDALLSVSYMERPESKYRLFRPFGVLLDVDSKYIYGGGRTDSGSGYKKSISNFKKDYIFGGHRESDREFISSLIKRTLNLSDEEYVSFVKNNSNKSMAEIEPREVREALIKNYALIHSNRREYNREYNEMYVSNPIVQGIYAYDLPNDKIGDVLSFVNEQPRFLKDYAEQNDLLFFVFGD